jgi:hypothetical protein
MKKLAEATRGTGQSAFLASTIATPHAHPVQVPLIEVLINAFCHFYYAIDAEIAPIKHSIRYPGQQNS